VPEPLSIGILYPTTWYGDPTGFDAAIKRLRGLDPTIEVRVVEYQEPPERRHRRQIGAADDALDETPPVSDEVADVLATAEILLAIDLPTDIVSRAPRLRWVQSASAGADHLLRLGLDRAGIRLTTGAGSNAVGIAEFVMGRLLEFWKDFPVIAERQAIRTWRPRYGRELAGSTIGLIGLGAINSQIAARLAAFDVQVLATRRSWSPGATAPNVDEVLPADRLHEMLIRCDAVIAAVRGTTSTEGLMNAKAFAAMPPGSWFCNVGRGTLVDEPALVAALTSGQLGGAAIDVQRHEPMADDDPLWDAPNLRLSFHNATAPTAMFRHLHTMFEANVVNYLVGAPMTNEANLPHAP
jgi:phosphoglycerate dehydrogenase-like enzyme